MTKEQAGPRGFSMQDEDDAQPLPQMTFTTLVLSLSTGAMVHLGRAALPGDEAPAAAPEPNLPLAKQTIDILEMLELKTKGNLEADEAGVLEQVLHELRLAYVDARNG